MLIHTQPGRGEAAVTTHCQRCGRPGIEAIRRVCVACRTQEEVARHIPPAQRWRHLR